MFINEIKRVNENSKKRSPGSQAALLLKMARLIFIPGVCMSRHSKEIESKSNLTRFSNKHY